MLPVNFDSDICGKLPLHLPNLIQPYGVLLIADSKTHNIVQVSENAPGIFLMPLKTLVGTNLGSLLNLKDYSSLQQKLTNQFHDKIPAVWEIGGRHLVVLVHKNGDHLLIEIDTERLIPGNQETFIDVYQELKYAMYGIEATTSLEETCRMAAAEVRRISGFDKVMIYQFDENWNGTVVAESKTDDMESYLRLTFPASDIPQQARELYKLNPYRFIPDRDYEPVRLFPVINPITSSFVDLSGCNLRSVATVHLEYLKNMNVQASMSTRILFGEKLWGLIACHHKTAKHLNYQMCSVFEMLSSIISLKVTYLENQASFAFLSELNANYSALAEAIYRSDEADGVLLAEEGVMKLLNASGAILSRGGRYVSAGDVPRPEQVEELLLWLHTRQLKNVYSTNSLGNEYEYAHDYRQVASGILVIPINSYKDEYLIVVRPEKTRTINWGGNPHERIQFEKGTKVYHPRDSFKKWMQQVVGSSLDWHPKELEVAERLRSFIYEYETSDIS